MRSKRWWVAAAYAVALLLLTLSPVSWLLNRLTVGMYVFWRYTLGNTDSTLVPEDFGFLLNIVLFIPLGIGIAILLRRHWVFGLLVSALVSAAIEAVQLIPFLDRQADLSDIVSNTIGGALGAAVGAWWLRRRSGHAERL